MIEQVEAPPPLRRPHREGRYQTEADWMRAHPGQWTVIRDTSQAVGNQMRRGDYSAFRPTEDWEITQRVREDNPKRYDIYVRFVNIPALKDAPMGAPALHEPPPPPVAPPSLPMMVRRSAPMPRDVIPELDPEFIEPNDRV